jgi:hypothetical protein
VCPSEVPTEIPRQNDFQTLPSNSSSKTPASTSGSKVHAEIARLLATIGLSRGFKIGSLDEVLSHFENVGTSLPFEFTGRRARMIKVQVRKNHVRDVGLSRAHVFSTILLERRRSLVDSVHFGKLCAGLIAIFSDKISADTAIDENTMLIRHEIA